MTKVEMFRAIAQVEGLSAEQVDFLNAEADKVAARNAKRSSTPSPKQKENAATAEQIKAMLADSDNGMTATEIGKALGLSTQKVSAIIRNTDGIVKSYVKKVAYFSLA